MISFCIVHKGGLILYQHTPQDDTSDDKENSSNPLASVINMWMSQVYLNPTKSLTDRKAWVQPDANHKTFVEWQEDSDYIAMAAYPDIRHEDRPWIAALLQVMLTEFALFVSYLETTTTSTNGPIPAPPSLAPIDASPFDKTFQLLFQQYKDSDKQPTTTASNTTSTTSKAAKKPGKEKRNWHDGKAKVTKEAMDSLDFSKTSASQDNDEGVDKDAVALAEARAAYLPTQSDLQAFQEQKEEELQDDDDEDDPNSTPSWGDSFKGIFLQATGQKVLTSQDLEAPLQEMHKQLTSKNVAADIAQHITDNVKSSLVGKKLSSMYRVKTAVRQALDKSIQQLLLPSTRLDLLRQVVSKREALFGNKKPYVIVVVGINGVGKSTSLSKLAYYLKTNGCRPLLAACDTFRSGAVEQLTVHAKCLDLPIFHQGYSKDPSSVAKAAIEQATKDGNDVVLVDTAGRMQNNVPLMKALGKLTADNQPDMVVFVGEALVGNDGIDQVRMFHQAVSSVSRTQKVNAILLTKFDTVSDKVGAALTMTHVTNAPILFVGTGQKYHHLQKLSTASVIKSLFQ
eukprot:Nitzschia sp. Nitz4//scaffold52_size167869//16264//17967//NITZ4_002258-RA/size167869-processed-gene-0.121-mRNA-1//1//CDS//3329553981//78//frame0